MDIVPQDINTAEEVFEKYFSDGLNDAQKLSFEANLSSYPELIDKFANIQNMFNNIDELQYNDRMKKASSNISVKVVERRSKAKIGKV